MVYEEGIPTLVYEEEIPTLVYREDTHHPCIPPPPSSRVYSLLPLSCAVRLWCDRSPRCVEEDLLGSTLRIVNPEAHRGPWAPRMCEE